MRQISCLILFLSTLAAWAGRLNFAGVVGNSGGEGPTVVRGAVGRGGGVVTDAQGRLFTSGGDRILTLSRRGTLLWETPLPKPGWVLGGATFAVGGGPISISSPARPTAEKALTTIFGTPSRWWSRISVVC